MISLKGKRMSDPGKSQAVQEAAALTNNGDSEQTEPAHVASPALLRRLCVCCPAVVQEAVSRDRVSRIFRLALPVVTAYLLQLTLGVVNVMFVGHLGPTALGAAALGNMFCNVTGFSCAFGMATAMDTLGSQAFGSGQMKRVGLVAQRVAAFLTVAIIPLYALWLFATEPLLHATGQDPELAVLAGQYVRVMAFGFWPGVMYEVLKKYLQVQRIVTVIIYINLIANVVHVFLCWLFIHGLGQGFLGAPTALACTYWTLLLVGLGLVVAMNLHVDTWPGILWSQLAREWRALTALALPGAAMLCFEWWCFEIMALLVGSVGKEELDSWIILINVLSLLFMVPLGISIGASTLTGNALGANQPEEARRTALCVVLLCICTSVTLSGAVVVVGNKLAAPYTEDTEVISKVGATAPLLALALPFDHLQGVFSGVIRGSGRQNVGLWVNLLGYYCIGFPVSYILCMHSPMPGLEGVWVGLLLAVGFTSTTYGTILWRTDWSEQARRAQSRLAADDRGADEVELHDSGTAYSSDREQDGYALAAAQDPADCSDTPGRGGDANLHHSIDVVEDASAVVAELDSLVQQSRTRRSHYDVVVDADV